MYRTRIMLPCALALLALLTTLPAVSATPQTLRAEFDAKLTFQGEKPTSMPFAGTLSWNDPDLRVEFSDALTTETRILLVDFEKDLATLLYPDTLNGTRARLSEFDDSGHLARLRDMLNGNKPDVPKGWTSENLGSADIGKDKCQHTAYKASDGKRIDVWMDGKQRPKRIELNNGGVKISVQVSKFTYDVDFPSGTFSYGKDYQISEFDAGSEDLVHSL